jgi:hypothetical protein
MLGDRGVTAVHLSFDEIASLWMASSLARVASALPWGGSARSALDKLLVSVPKARAKELRSLLRRVVIGAPAPAELVAGAGTPTGELLGCVEQAFRKVSPGPVLTARTLRCSASRQRASSPGSRTSPRASASAASRR